MQQLRVAISTKKKRCSGPIQFRAGVRHTSNRHTLRGELEQGWTRVVLYVSGRMFWNKICIQIYTDTYRYITTFYTHNARHAYSSNVYRCYLWIQLNTIHLIHGVLSLSWVGIFPMNRCPIHKSHGLHHHDHSISHEQNVISNLVGGFDPSEKYESQLGWLFPIYGKTKNVPNHQPEMYRQISDTPHFCCGWLGGISHCWARRPHIFCVVLPQSRGRAPLCPAVTKPPWCRKKTEIYGT